MKSVPEQIIKTVFDGISAANPGFPISFAIGRRTTEENSGAPRIVAIPLGASSIDEADRIGDSKDPNYGRCLYVRQFQIEWQCHDAPDDGAAAEFGRAENLMLAVVLSIRSNLHSPQLGSVQINSEEWLEQREGEDSYDRFGTVIRLQTTFAIPVFEPRGGLVFLTGTPAIHTTVKLAEDTANIVSIDIPKEP